jgi:hypothetical protein
MRTEQFNLTVDYQGLSKEVEVNIAYQDYNVSIGARVDGHHISFQPDHHHTGLRPVYGSAHFDPELCFQIGQEICRQRLSAF